MGAGLLPPDVNEEPPTLIYDDDCGVCTRAAEWVARHGDVRIVGFSDLTDGQIDRLPEDWRECAHLFADGTVYSCGEAMEEAFLRTDDAGTRLVRVARDVPGYPRLREFGYRVFADNRSLAGRLIR